MGVSLLRAKYTPQHKENIQDLGRSCTTRRSYLEDTFQSQHWGPMYTFFCCSCHCLPALSLHMLSFVQTGSRRQESVDEDHLLGSDSTSPFASCPLEAAWPRHLRLNHSPVPPLNPHLRSSFERKVSSIWRLLRERLNHLMMSHVKIKLMQMLIWQPASLERAPARPWALC